MADQSLSGIKVIDLTHHIAGPYCAKFFADYGAEVIKVERPDGGDPARRLGPFPGDIPHPEKSGLFLHLNTNKKGITLNLKTETGKSILKELVESADILVENFEPRVMPSLGLSYETLKEINPELVMVSISNFGQTGPYRDYKATEIVSYAMGGVMWATGTIPEREPLKLGLTVIQMQAGNVAAAAAMGALFGAKLGGTGGEHVDVSIQETQVSTMDRGGPNFTAYAYSGQPTYQRAPSGGRFVTPTANFPCLDGYVAFNVSRVPWWPNFLKLIEHEELLESPLFPVPEGLYNIENKDLITALTAEWCLNYRKQEIMEKGQALGLAITTLATPADIFTDPHFAYRGFLVEIDHPETGKLKYPGAPFRPAETPWKAGRAPLLGEHNEEIYCGRLGHAKEDLVRLRERGII